MRLALDHSGGCGARRRDVDVQPVNLIVSNLLLNSIILVLKSLAPLFILNLMEGLVSEKDLLSVEIPLVEDVQDLLVKGQISDSELIELLNSNEGRRLKPKWIWSQTVANTACNCNY